MSFDILYQAIGMLDADIIEAVEKSPRSIASAKVAKPWLKWVVAAIVIAVFAIGTPIALNMMGIFKNNNILSPSFDNSGEKNDNSGIVMPIDSNEPESDSKQISEDTSSSKDGDSSGHSSGTPANSSGQEATIGSSVDTNESSASVPSGENSSESDSSGSTTFSGGDSNGPLSFNSHIRTETLINANMPDVTYRINGENKTFSYSDSTFYIISPELTVHGKQVTYTLDHYFSKDGSVARTRDGSGELIEYYASDAAAGTGEPIDEEAAAEAAKRALLNTDLPFDSIENLAVTSLEPTKRTYEVLLSFTGGKAEVVLTKAGGLKSLIVYKDASVGLPPERVAAASEKYYAKIETYKSIHPGVSIELYDTRYEKLGNKVYAVFYVSYYSDQGSMVLDDYYEIYCLV